MVDHGPLTIACVLKSGGDFEPWMVDRLRRQVGSHLRQAHSFVCLSDCDLSGPWREIRRIPLEDDWTGWFSKLELFKHDLGPTVYFDLDTAIVGPLDWISGITDGLWGLRDPLWGKMGSGMVGWTGPQPDILDGWDKGQESNWQTMPDRWGDQSWIYQKVKDRVRYIQDEFPGEVYSYKFDKGKAPRSVKIFSGRPRPWEVGF